MVLPLTIGTQIKGMAGKSGIVWAMDGDVPAMLFFIASPDEFSLIDATQKFEFAVKKVDNIIFVCAKCGQTPWYSAPLNPYMAEDYVYDAYDAKVGKPVELYVVNKTTGIIEKAGNLSLTPDFSKKLEDMMKELHKEEFDSDAYRANVKKAYDIYKTDEDIAKAADFTCSVVNSSET